MSICFFLSLPLFLSFCIFCVIWLWGRSCWVAWPVLPLVAVVVRLAVHSVWSSRPSTLVFVHSSQGVGAYALSGASGRAFAFLGQWRSLQCLRVSAQVLWFCCSGCALCRVLVGVQSTLPDPAMMSTLGSGLVSAT